MKNIGRTKTMSLLLALAMLLSLVPGMGMTAYADNTCTVTFKANGRTVSKEVTLPHTFSCNYSSENGEFDLIIKELYQLDGGCCGLNPPTVSGSTNVTGGISGDNQYITVNAPFEGTATFDSVYFDSSKGYMDFEIHLEISCTGAVAAYSVTITPGSNMTKTSGEASQTGLSGPMTAVVYTANDGYKFPETSEAYTTTNGITVAVSQDQKTITVSGTPTADTSITIPDAVEELLTTITATGKEQANYSTANVATVSFSYSSGGSSAYLANWGWWGYGWTATVTPADGYTVTKCVFYDDANRTATDSEAPFVVETTEEDKTPRINGTPIDGGNFQSKGLKKIEVYGYATPAHTHDFTYSASGATITATCGEGCDITEGLTLTISAPTGDLTADGTKTFPATLSTGYNTTAFPGTYAITYTKDGAEFTGTPTEAGEYTASVTVGTATASVSYTVYASKDTQTITASDVTATYGDTLGGVTLPTGWSWVNGTASVGNVGTNSFKANFTPADTANYNTVSDVNVSVTVGKANPTYTVPTGLTATYGDTLSAVTLPTGWAWADGTQSVGNVGTNTFKASFVPTDTTNYNTKTNIDVSVTVGKANITPTVSVEGWTYGQEANAPSVSGNSGNGAVTYTYAAKGSDSFSATVPTNAGNYTVKATVAATTNYNGGTATADFTIAKDDITPTVSIDGWTYNQTAKTPSVSGNSGNGAVTYTYAAKGSDSFSATVPTNAGNYTVKATIAATANYNGGSATANFTIAKANPTYTAPTGVTATYGDTLADIALPTGWTWADNTASVGNAGTNTFKANFTPADTANYHTVNNIDVTVTVAKASQTAPAAPTEAGKTINSITLNEIPNGEYKCGAGDWQTSPTFTGLDQNKGYVFRQRYAADANHNASADSEETVIYTANHEHSFTYSVSGGATITATCNGAGTCNLTDNKVSFALTAPTSLVYNGTDKKATLEGVAAFNAATGMNVSADDIVYNYKAKSSDSAVVVTETKNAGIYQALYTLQTDFPRPFVGISFTIAKANPTYTAPTGVTATYGDTLADVARPDGWAWVDDTTSVGDVGTKTFKANFTPADTTNYNVVENVDVTVKVNPADITPTVTLDGWTYGVEANTPSVTGNAGNGDVAYTYAQKGSDNFSATVPTNAGNYTVKATIAATPNYNGATATADFTIAKVDSVPATVTANKLTCDGTEKALVTVTGEVAGGEMQYALGKDAQTAPEDGWSTDIPAAANTGTYFVWYKVVANENHNDSTPVCVEVTIDPDYTVKEVTGLSGNGEDEWTKGGEDGVVITVKDSGEDNSFDHFTGVKLDGQILTKDVDYTVTKGSTIVTLLPATLEKLSVGEHTVTVLFDNGEVGTALTVLAANAVPQTGDSTRVGPWIALMALSLYGLLSTLVAGKKKRIGNR